MAHKPVNVPKTAEEQLNLMRQGYKAELRIKLGGLEIPVRLMSAIEEADTIANAKTGLKIPDQADPKLHVSIAVMKAVLEKAANVDGVPYLSRKCLDGMTHQELNALYDQYLTVCDSVNPEFEDLEAKQISDMIVAVKKNEKAPTDFFTSDLAAIGRFFLVQIQAEANAAGS